MHVSLVIICGMLGLVTASTWEAAPYTLFRQKRCKWKLINLTFPIITLLFISAPQRTRFFTGNNAVDAGAAGAAFGVATQYFANQIFNPCTRGGTRNKNTNNRIFGGQTIQNGALGFALGFAGASLANNALGNPCGR